MLKLSPVSRYQIPNLRGTQEAKLKYEPQEVWGMKCPKCGGKMVKGATAEFGDVFACTRREEEKPEPQRLDKVQPYYCEGCGYIEFYKEYRRER
jgi:predicted nucleic-acid-binding Zn-ribbon protein